jgi:thiol:disulfide interchange protein
MMKVLLFAITLLLTPLSAYNGFISMDAGGRGISFFKGSFTEALDKAKLEHKPLFLDFYAKWCGPCKALKRSTFNDKEAGAYFNKNFVNYSIDAESKEGKEIAASYGVKSYPSMFIVDSTGKVLARTTGFQKPYILINFGRRVIP